MQLKNVVKTRINKKYKDYTVYIPQHSTGIRAVNRIQCNP